MDVDLGVSKIWDPVRYCYRIVRRVAVSAGRDPTAQPPPRPYVRGRLKRAASLYLRQHGPSKVRCIAEAIQSETAYSDTRVLMRSLIRVMGTDSCFVRVGYEMQNGRWVTVWGLVHTVGEFDRMET